MILLDGKMVSTNLKNNLRDQVINLKNKYCVTPKLAIVLVGNNQASQVYVKNKIKACEYTGINCELIEVNSEISEHELLNIVDKLNNDN